MYLSKLFLLVVFLNCFASFGRCLELHNGAYEDLVVSISDRVPVTNCKEILHNLEEALSTASRFLFSALHGRAHIKSATVILPSLWPNSCASKNVMPLSGETSDIVVLPNDPSRGFLWTEQSAGCEQPGDQIYLGYGTLEQKDPMLGHSLIKEFAKYRYGVFEEQGYKNDPVYPMCFYDGNSVKITGCSDFKIDDNGICDGSSNEYNVSKMVDAKARTSIMFAAEAPSVSMFCDAGNHDPYAPTKHNFLCKRRSSFDVILTHSDFRSEFKHENEIMDTRPKISYRKLGTTRFILVVENTNDMAIRDSWQFLRSAIKKLTTVDLPENTELGLILTNDTDAIVASPLASLSNSLDRLTIPAAMPYNPGETGQIPCLHCAIRKALDIFAVRAKGDGQATNVIILVAPGMNNNTQVMEVVKEAKNQKVKIATINYPMVVKQLPLDLLAEETNGMAYSVIERKFNVQQSMLSTYFQLTNTLYNTIETFYSGNRNDLPMEIHRREIRDGRFSITGSFVLDEDMGEPSRFMLYIPNGFQPLIKSIKLISPSQYVFSKRIDMLEIKFIQIESNITEPGTWTYTIELLQGNPQSHFLQIMATPKSKTSEMVRAKFWTRRNQPGGPLILLTKVNRGDFPIMSAKVTVHVTKLETNGSILHQEVFELLDTGSGDPDITKGDGIYTRYFSASNGGAGLYTFEVTVSDNGNTAYTWQNSSNIFEDNQCCGSAIPVRNSRTLVPFERVLQPITMEISSDDIRLANQVPVGRILDLKREILAKDKLVRLSWTAPDMGGHKVTRYEVRHASNIADITEHFETNAKMWEWGKPFPLAIGSETTFTVDMSDFLGEPVYFAVRAYSQVAGIFTISNYVRVFLDRPPSPPPVAPPYKPEFPSGTGGDINAYDEVTPSKNDSANIGVEIILPILAGCLLLVLLLILYYCFCVKKRNRNHQKDTNKAKSLENDKMNSITIVPNTPINNPQAPPSQCYANQLNENDHTIGVPVTNMGYDDEPKKRYSLVHQQEQQLIEELKQQQQLAHQQRNDQMNQPNNYGALSVISNNGTIQRNQPTLSPYNSWSASQLLHEHERRQSPMEMGEEPLLTHHQEMMTQLEHMSLGGQNGDHLSLNGHQIPEHYNPVHIAPPVPPLPVYNQNHPYSSSNIYGVHQPQSYPNQAIYQTMPRTDAPFAPSLQGSLNSVNSGEKKRRNVTMV